MIRKDLPYITCQVCKIAMGEVWDIAEQMRKDAPYNRVDEGEFQELTFGICDPDIEEGEWITMYDVVQHGGAGAAEDDGADNEDPDAVPAAPAAGGRIAVEKQEYVGECRRECRTMAKACNNVFDEHREDLAETLWKRDANTKEKLTSRVCTKWAKVCPSKPVPADHVRPRDAPRDVGDEAEGPHLSSPSGAAVRRAMVPDGRGLVQDEAHAVADQPHDREARPAARAVRRSV